MKLWALCAVVPVAVLVGTTAQRWVEESLAADDVSLALPAPSEAPASGGAEAAPIEPAELLPPVGMPELRATTPEEVRAVLRYTREATGRERPALIEAALHAEDPLVAGNAAKALGRLKAFTSDPALLELTADPRLRVRQDAVTACGLDGGVEAIPYLEQVLEAGDPSVRPIALDALGRIGGEHALELVERIADDPETSHTERVFARVALENMRI